MAATSHAIVDIIEGAHRIDALDYLGAKAFPAIVVVSYDD